MAKAKTELAIERSLIEQLGKMGYTPVTLKNYDDMKANLRTQLCITNRSALIEAKREATLSDTEFERLLRHLAGHTVYDSAKILRDEWVLQLDDGNTVYMRFLHADATKNTYQVTHQITMDKKRLADVKQTNRYDVTVLINGLPLIQIELKRPGEDWRQALNQINRYRRTSFQGLFRFIQIFVVSNGTQTRYFANVNENNPDGTRRDIMKSLAFYWTDENNRRINRLSQFAESFLPPRHATDMICRHMVIKATEQTLFVLRPYQIWAIRLSKSRVLDASLDGYCYGATGSGKTLTSFMLATTFRDDPRIERTFLLVDRKDLDDQTVAEYNSFSPGCVDNTESTKALVNALRDSTKTLIIVTIQKLANALKNPKYEKVMADLRDTRCVFIIDECHRSQFGRMHADIQRHFRKANYIGFTGTPIFDENKGASGKTTADLFRSGTLDPCIHRYMISDAIADGNVLPFHVEYRSSINIKGIRLYGIDPKKLDDPSYRKQHNIDMDAIYHNDKRIDLVAQDIVDNLERLIQPGTSDRYTAIFATDRIATLMAYYHKIRDKKPEGMRVAAIFTYAPNADFDEGQDQLASDYLTECMDDYNSTYGTAYDISTFDAYRKDIAKRLRQENTDGERLDLLLVVDMFLTGFDSKPTNTLILDKDLKWHSLVQAYSRTNRVHKPTKQMGQIVTYRDNKHDQDEALRLFSGGGDPNEYLVQPYSHYLDAYKRHATELRQVAPVPDDAGYITDENEQRKFVLAFRKLARDLSVMRTFSEFEWSQIDGVLDDDEFQDYKGWYLEFYDRQERNRKRGKDTVLADIDFELELIRTDKVNTSYIMALLKDINRADKDEMRHSIDLILRELERSDNDTVRHKQDTLKAFIETRFFELEQDADIETEFAEYEKHVLTRRIEEFAYAHGVDETDIASLVAKGITNQTPITREEIRECIKRKKLPFRQMNALVNDMQELIDDLIGRMTEDE